MQETVEDRIIESLSFLEELFNKDPEAKKHIEELVATILKDESVTDAIEAIEIIYGEQISDSITRILSVPIKTISIIKDGDYKNEKFLSLFILKYKKVFLRVRQIEETGFNTLIKIAETISDNIINYTIQTADNTYFEFRVSQENQLGIINYFTKVLSNHIQKSTILDLDDLKDFESDLASLNETINTLKNNIEKKIEEVIDGED